MGCPHMRILQCPTRRRYDVRNVIKRTVSPMRVDTSLSNFCAVIQDAIEGELNGSRAQG